MFLETSRDILNITLSVCALALTVFLCWGIFYGIKIIRGIFDIIDQIQRTAQRIEQMVIDAKDKIERYVGSARLAAEAVKGVLEYIAERKNERKAERGS